ncbi:putative membrane protein [Pleurocapsa sp. PCC 7327]|uniref:PrsW family glutamic-type intramembrane protease n=1 Tax=Pleurocapsa sp. PCC 7327 TaxID=118163 RepID=UPI00029FD369|nr:PrsW family glutamic-type intramembrane protease [Pleurocapsa sp. PCC 7327]AFY77197.1 putative membrane protein [Pleurocapsa sp. PCC 7327]
MMEESSHQPFLKQVSQIVPGTRPIFYQLSGSQSIVIGRESDCQVILDSTHYQGVSRRHAKISPAGFGSLSEPTSWQICDLGSSNGTYINGQRLYQCQTLKAGDLIKLGHQGPEFLFESQTHSAKTNTGIPIRGRLGTDLSLTQLIPIVSTQSDLRWRELMIPGAVTVFFVVLMFNYVGTNPAAFMWLLGVFLASACYYVIDRLCGRHKAWWAIVATAIATIIFNLTLFNLFAHVFRYILPGNIEELSALRQQGEAINPIDWFVRMFFGAGLLEEFTKSLPVFAFYLIGRQLRSPLRERVGVWEPLDGILLGAASGIGFTLDETLGQYVQMAIQRGGELAGLQLLIPRILGAIAVHVAYSGYFGYFIGLSALKPSKRWQLLAIGYLSSSFLHTLWNSADILSQNALMNSVLQCAAGVLAYAFLISAILKARQISATRAQDLPTRLGSSN